MPGKIFNNKSIHQLIIPFFLIGLFGSCRLGKEYQRPELELPKQFTSVSFSDTSSIADIEWKNFFTNPDLQKLINDGIAYNHDLLIAMKRIEISQRQLKQARLLQVPEVNLQLTGQINRPSNNSLNGVSIKSFLGQSYILPFAVVLSVPTGILGVFAFINLRGIDNNIYVQVGLIMLVGLLAKNAILIVEYALQRRRAGMGLMESALEASQLRLRPILMTSFAFIVGLLPLTWAKGGTALGDRSIGTSAAGGMLTGVLLGVFVIPVLFVIFQFLQEKISGKPKQVTAATEHLAE